jgi:hypothetical protein
LESHLEGNTCFLSGGAPDSPVHHRTDPVACPVRDLLPNWALLIVGATIVLAHRTLSGAHRTVRCANYPLAQAMRRPLIALPTVGAVDRWLTGQSGAPPDSPVNYSRTLPNFSRELPVHRSSAWRTGHYPVHHRTLSSAPPDSPVCQTELSLGCTQPSLLHLFSFLLFICF